MTNPQGTIFNIQPFSLHDGPGTRTTVFMKGCNLRCWWCHNPESWALQPELMLYASRCIGCGACAEVCPAAANGQSARFTADCTGCGRCAEECFAGAVQLAGERISASELVERLLGDLDVYQRSGGGVTFSGGEPLLQPDLLESALVQLRARGVHIAVESALNVPRETVARIAPLVDLFFTDIKHLDSEKHREATGAPNERILANLRFLSESGSRLTLRTPVIPGFNDDEAAIGAIGDFIAALPARHPVELLAFHGLCSGKYEALRRPFAAANLQEPSREQMQRLTSLLLNRRIDALYRM